jgi:hypothetical protein
MDTSLYNYTYYNYLGDDSTADYLNQISSFRKGDTNDTLNSSSVASICQSTTGIAYEFVTSGLFQASDVINLYYYRVDPIDQIQVKFNLLSIAQSMTVYVTINSQQVYTKTFGTFSDVDGTYVLSNTAGKRSMMTIPALTQSTAPIILASVDTGVVNYTVTSSFAVGIKVASTSARPYIWGLQDVVVYMRDCQTCVSQAVSSLIAQLLIAALLNLVVVIALVIILGVATKLE